MATPDPWAAGPIVARRCPVCWRPTTETDQIIRRHLDGRGALCPMSNRRSPTDWIGLNTRLSPPANAGSVTNAATIR